MDLEVAHGLMFHHFHSDIHPPGQGSISGDDFRNMILFYGPENFLNAQEWFDRAESNSLKPNQVCLTFDDNLRCQYDVALPVMREFGITGFWFVYTSVLHGVNEPLEIFRSFRSTYPTINEFYGDFFDHLKTTDFHPFVQEKLKNYNSTVFLADFPFYSENDKLFRYIRDEIISKPQYDAIMFSLMESKAFDYESVAQNLWMTRDQIADLHNTGNIVGLHSYTHPTRMGNLSRADQTHEYTANEQDLIQILGHNPIAMSHPCNSYNQDTLEILDQLGVRLGFRANMVKPRENKFEYPRIDHAIVMNKMTAANP